MARELPGFYYDEEKGKYFRIQQSHRAIPGSAYTKQSISASKQKKVEQDIKTQQETRRRLQTVDRSKTHSQITSLPLSARIGSTPTQNASRVVREYAQKLSRHRIGHDGGRVSPKGFSGSTFSITRSGTLRTAYEDPSSVSQRYILSATSCYRSNTTASDRTSQTPAFNTHSPCLYPNIADFQIAHLITTLYSHDEEYAILTSGGGPTFNLRPVTPTGEPSPGLELTTYPREHKVHTIWDLAGSPDIPSFVLATDTGLILGRCESGHNVSGASYTLLARGEKMNAAFKDAHVVMSGERSGRVVFSDVRAGATDSVVRLLHSSAVLGTVGLPDTNSHQVLVHGYSSTCVYDLRFVKQAPVKRKARSTQVAQRSVPVVDFAVPGGRWTDHYSRGRKVAYSADLGVVVAASFTTGNAAERPWEAEGPLDGFVTLYSVKTGRVVDSPLTRHKYGHGVKSVDVRRVRDGPESIFCLAGERLDEWTIQGCDGVEVGNRGEEPTDEKVHTTIEQFHNGDMASTELRDQSIEQEWDRGNQTTGRIRN